MSFSVAFGLALASATFALYLDFQPRQLRLLPWLLKIWGGAYVLSILLDVQIPFDSFFARLMNYEFFSSSPHMHLGTALSLFLYGAAIICMNRGKNYELIIAGSISCFVGWIGLIGLLGHSIDTDMELTWGAYSQMNTPSAIAMIFLGFALPVAIYFRHRRGNQFYALAFNVALIFISITVLMEQAFVRLEVQKNRQAVDFKADSIAWEIKSAVAAQYQSFRRMAARLERHTYNNAEDWAQDTRAYMQDFKGIRAVSSVDQNYVLRWIYPTKDNWISGRDIKKDPDRFELLRSAKELHQDLLSRPLNLWVGGVGSLLGIPIYPHGKYGGTLVVVYEFDKLFTQILNLQGYSLEISEGDAVIYRSGLPDSTVSSRWISRQTLDLLDRHWNMVLTPDRETLRQQGSWIPGIVLFFGLIISTVVCLAAYFYMSTREAERRAREVASWQTAIMEGSNLIIVSTDRNLIVKSYNRAAERLLGYKAEEVVGKTTPMLWHDETEMSKSKIEESLSKGKTFSFECTFISREGQRYLVSLVVNPLFDDEGGISGFVGIAEDITEKRSQAEKMQTSARLSSLGEMAAGIAHEINNPLTIIGAHAASVRRSLENKNGESPDGAIKKMEAIERTVQRIARIIRGLRSFAREVPDEELSDVSVRALVDETLSFCSERFRNADIDLQVKVDEGLKVRGHEHQLSQVLLNLLNNAFDATQGMDVRQVAVEAAVIGGEVQISVTDSGSGVPEELRQKIMQPFFTTKEVGQGLGLGLSISQGIIRAHRGQLTLDPRSTRTRFVISLPA